MPMCLAWVPRENWLLKKRLKQLSVLFIACVAIFAGATVICLKPVTQSFDRIIADSQNIPVTDRNGNALSVTYQTPWNYRDTRALYNMPDFLVKTFLYSEDRKFYDHDGVDWKARGAALYQTITKRHNTRGASTITEQVVRMINSRPRNLWSKWLEGIEATLLERDAQKPAILEFYLNQIPYASGRRGVTQAARYYFNRDLETLSTRETLALAVLARAPSAYDLYRSPEKITGPMDRLAKGLMNADKLAQYNLETLDIQKPSLPVEARHFVRFTKTQTSRDVVRTTIDGTLQTQVQDILDSRLKKLSSKNVTNGAALIIDHSNGHILAWVVAGARDKNTKAGDIDPVLSPRQPGSTLKPFLYANALEKGWNAATMLNDAPMAEAVGAGLHRFRNYSNMNYGPLTLREALGNSLNIPAILTVNYVGVDRFLSSLHDLGFESLTRDASVYDEGLALGNGEVTLYELTRAYAALANRGNTRPLQFLMNDNTPTKSKRIYSDETASLIGNILSDPRARALEFGNDSILNFPHRTAAKTGTSTDYRDAWAVAYNDRYTVGIWMGNLDRAPMKDVTGSTGPALAMRSIFQVLNKNRDANDLYLSPSLIEADICTRPAATDGTCPKRTEYFSHNLAPEIISTEKDISRELIRPTHGLRMAYDPRIPAGHQKFRFEIAGLNSGEEVEWILNGNILGRTNEPRYLWPVAKGPQKLAVVIYKDGAPVHRLQPISFSVR